MPTIVNCPNCKKQVEWIETNLGEWADEAKSIPCGANKDQQTIKLPDFDIEDIEAMLSEQSEDFFKE